MSNQYAYLYKPSNELWDAVIEARDETGIPYNRIIDNSLREYLGVKKHRKDSKPNHQSNWSVSNSGTGF